MSETNTTTNLRALLYALHGRRTEIAQTAAAMIQDAAATGEKTDSTGSTFGADLKVVQEQIEAVERAIADELKMANEASSSSFEPWKRPNPPTGIV